MCSVPNALDERLDLELNASAGAVSEARSAVGTFARRLGSVETDVKLAVSEAVTNAVLHAYRDRPPGRIRLRAQVIRQQLLVTVSDDGAGLTPNPSANGLGLGLSIIGKVASDVRVRSSERGTSVAMAFPIPSP
jgi:stage II sporulation protein AB (anti-sigma F factor)